jgi:mannose-1-phosphate guanylyltransferase/phosphomannomutase
LPEVFLGTSVVRTPSDLKGAVMRHVASSATSDRLILLDGVRVAEEDGWVLVIPDADEPACRIWAEGETPAALERILRHYEALVAEVVGDGDAATNK